jgi:hypothetical protein
MNSLRVYSRRWGHPDLYRIRKTDTGWHISHIVIGVDCDTKGQPYLFKNLVHDSVNYPADLGGYMDYLWRQAHTHSWTEKQIQPKLNALGRWISKIEFDSPKGIFEAYR